MAQKRSFKWIYCLLLVFGLFGLARLYYRTTDDFRLGNIHYQLPFEAPWKVPELTAQEQQQLSHLLKQKFTYIGKGAQCYAFVSEDGEYVLKFFKFKHLKPSLWVNLLPSIPPFKDYKQSCIERKQHKLFGVFDGYDIAYRENRQDSELLYLHLLPTHHLQQDVTVIDKIGLQRTIHLDDVVFLVQKKGETLRTRLRQLLDQQHLQEAEQAIASIIGMYISEYKKGVYDRDHGVMHNTGFVGNRPFHLDVGKFTKEERMRDVNVYKKDLEHVLWKIDRWVKTDYPQYYPTLSPFLAQQYQQWTGETFDVSSIDPQRFKKKRHGMFF